MATHMDFSLDEAESEFLQAVLSGIEARHGFGVARGQEGAAAQHDNPAATADRSVETNPPTGSALTVRQETHEPLTAHGPQERPERRRSPPTLRPQHTAAALGGSVGTGHTQTDALLSATGEAAALNHSAGPCESQGLQPPPPLPPQHPPVQGGTRSPPESQLFPGAVSPVLAAMPARSSAATTARAPPAAPLPTSTPIGALTYRQPHSGRTLHLQSTLSTSTIPSAAVPSARSTSPFARLPTSHSTGAISEVSVATAASAPSTGSSSPSPSLTSRRFSGSALPGAASASAHAAAAMAPAAAVHLASGGSVSLASSRRAQGLLQRIQSLEAQLTELLLSEGDAGLEGHGDAAALGGEPNASSAVASGTDADAAAAFPDFPAAAGPLRPTGAGNLDHPHHPFQYPHNPHQQLRQHSHPHPHQQQAQVQVRISTTRSAGAGANNGPRRSQPQPQQHLRQHVVFWVAEQLCRDYNSSGVALMEAGLDEAAREQLAKALLLAGPGGPLQGSPDRQREMQIVAHNNLACYYRKFRQPALALEHLQHVARLETAAASETKATATANAGASSDNVDVAAGVDAGEGGAACTGGGDDGGGGGGGGCGGGQSCPTAATLLNLAAVSSSLGQHMQALSYAARGVRAAAGELQVPLAILESALLQGLPQAQLWDMLPQLRRAGGGATTQLAMAYYNRAVEQEHLHQWHAALESYRLAVDVASRFVGRGDELTLTMQQSAEAFKARFRKLERTGKVRATRAASQGCLNGGGTAGGCQGHALPPPYSSTTAAASTGNGAAGVGGCGGAVPLRPHPHLRPLLRCATAAEATMTVTSIAAAAAAAALVGLPARSSRTAALPSIAPSRTLSTPSCGDGGFAAGTEAEKCVAAVISRFDPRVAASGLVSRRALSAGRAAPQARAEPAGRGSASHVPAHSHPVAVAAAAAAAAAGGEPPRRGSAGNIPAGSHAAVGTAAGETRAGTGTGPTASSPRGSASVVPWIASPSAPSPAAAVLGRDTARAKRLAGWSPTLPPRPPPEASAGDLGRTGSSGSGSGAGGGKTPTPAGPRWGLESPGVAAPGTPPCAAGGEKSTTPRPLTSRQPNGGAAGGAAAVDAWTPRRRAASSCIPAVASSPPPVPWAPAPTATAMEAAPAASAAAEVRPAAAWATAAAAGSESASPARLRWREQRSELSEEGSLAAVAAAAVAAAAELERICAAGEDWQGESRDAVQGMAHRGSGAPAGGIWARGNARGNGCETRRAPGPKFVSLSSSLAQPQPAQKPLVGPEDGSVCVVEARGKFGGSGGVTARSAAAGGMLVPKRDGVAV